MDFIEADLTAALFEESDLAYSKFERSILEKADFRSAYHFQIDPSLNKIKKAKFSTQGLSGLLSQFDIDISE